MCSDKETINAAIPLLIDRIKNSDQILKDMPTTDHRIFEELIAEVFNGFGYTIELTKKTRDGGKDIVALKKKSGKEEKILIECKHWKDTVDVKEIRSLVGVAVGEEELPTGVILATTSRFSTEAKNYVLNNTIKIDLERKDYDDILEYKCVQDVWNMWSHYADTPRDTCFLFYNRRFMRRNTEIWY